MKWYNFLKASVIAMLCMISFSCSDDEKITQEPVSDSQLATAREVLQDSIVLNATAMQGTVNKTQLPQGCPLKYYFSWKSDDVMTLKIKHFSVGNMPLTIWFTIDVKFMKLNSWERDEYTGDGWIKFEGTKGYTSYIGNTKDYDDGEGNAGTVQGYFNANTHEIEFVTNFNVMNFTADVYKQKIDKSRMATFDADFAQYEHDLAEYKKAHGLD